MVEGYVRIHYKGDRNMSKKWFNKGLWLSLLVLAVGAVALNGAFGQAKKGQRITGESSLSNKKEEVIKVIITAQKLTEEKKFDDALSNAYRALRLSREMKEDLLEWLALSGIGSIHLHIGDRFIGSKFMMDSLQKEVKIMSKAALGGKGYFSGFFRDVSLLFVDFLWIDERYIFYAGWNPIFPSTSNLAELMELAEMPIEDDAPEEIKKIWPALQAEIQESYAKVARAYEDRDIHILKEASVQIFDLLEKMIQIGEKYAQQQGIELNEIAGMKELTASYRRFLKAFFNKDRGQVESAITDLSKLLEARLREELEIDDEEVDEWMQLDEKTREQELMSEIAQLQQELENEGKKLFQLLSYISPRNILNSYLFHFMKADRGLEPIFKRYAYLTASDLEPYREDILEVAKYIKERTGEGEKANLLDFPIFPPSSNFTTSDNVLAIYLALSPEGEWLHSGNPTHLLVAKEGVSGLLEEIKEKRLTGLNSDYAQGNLFLRMAIIHYDEGNIRESRSYLQQALDIFQKRADNDLIWQIQFMMGLQYKKEGDITQAIKHLADSVNTIERMRSSFRAENIRALLIEDKIFVYEFLIDLLVKMNRNAEALSYIERVKARILLDRLTDPRMKVVPSPKMATITKVQSALEKVDELLEEKLRREDKSDPQELDLQNKKIKSEEEKYQIALEELRYSNPEYASIISGETLTPDEIQKLIGDDTIILEYFIGAEKVYIFMVNNKGPVEAVITDIKYLALQDKISRFRESIEKALSSPLALKDYIPLARELYNVFIVPVENRIKGKRLCIVPHGISHFLPFHTLMKGDKYLIQDYQIFYSPSSSVLKHAFNKKRGGKSKVLIVANSDGTLSWADEEAERIAKLFPESTVFSRKRQSRRSFNLPL